MTRTAWQQFVLAHGWRTRDVWLARVLEQPAADIRRVKQTGACTRLPKQLNFGELFARRHGRPPADEEWPAPERVGGGYEWRGPELALLARLVGTTGPEEICRILTARLQQLTGDDQAARDGASLNRGAKLVGLQLGTDLVGGLTTREAGRRVGSLAVANQAVHSGSGTIRTIRVGKRHVIPHAEFERWLATREQPPDGWIRLTTLRQPLGISSDSKLPEYAALGYIPDVRLVKGIGTARGVWYIAPERAKRILEDASAGRPMPWHGKPLLGNQRAMWAKWQRRRHRWCRTCTRIWGGQPPRTFEEFCARYCRRAQRASITAAKRELGNVEREIRSIVAAVKRGVIGKTMAAELAALEQRQGDLQQLVNAAPPPTLRKGVAESYREKIAALYDSLVLRDAGAIDRIRGLVDKITISADRSIKIHGDLAAMLTMGAGARSGDQDALYRTMQVVAGARNQHCLQLWRPAA